MSAPRIGSAGVLTALVWLADASGAAPVEHACARVQAADGSRPFASDAVECAVKAAPASTFKVSHALIALETGVVTDPLALVP